jgi:hypothetical protein
MSSSIEIEGGKKCKSYQRRSRETGRCRNISGSRKMSSRSNSSRSRRRMVRMVRGGQIVPETDVSGGEVEGGKRKVPCKSYQVRRKSGKAKGHCVGRKSSSRRRRSMMGGEVDFEGGDFEGGNFEGGEVEGGEVEGGKRKVPCKSYQKRKKSTGRCKNVKNRMSKSMLKSMSKSMRGGEVLEGGQTLQGGSTPAAVEPVISGGSVVVPEIALYEPVSMESVLQGGTKKYYRSYMKGGNSAPTPVDLQGGENAETVEGGGMKKKCKRGKTRKGTGVCHKPKSRSRSGKSKSRSRSRKSRSRM